MSDRLTDDSVTGLTNDQWWHPNDGGRPSLSATAYLAREVQASRKLIADLRALHRPDSENDPWCDEDGFCYPCRTVRMIDEAGL